MRIAKRVKKEKTVLCFYCGIPVKAKEALLGNFCSQECYFRWLDELCNRFKRP
jgi:endogenous inhibitor of DNA gyrase (YacG/DUF329 family)